MRWLCILGLALAGIFISAPLVAAQASEGNGYLSLRSVNDTNDAVRCIKHTNYFKVGVLGNREFTLQLIDSYPGKISGQWIYLSTGETLTVADGLTSYNCSYRMLYFGLAISEHQDGTVSTLSFWINPAWHPEDRDLIPVENPEPVRPIAMENNIDAEVNAWWITEVEPYLKLQASVSGQPDAS